MTDPAIQSIGHVLFRQAKKGERSGESSLRLGDQKWWLHLQNA